MDISAILIQYGLLTEEACETIDRVSSGDRIDRQLVENGVVSEEQVLRAFAQEFGTRFLDASEIAVDRELLATFPAQEIFRHNIFPVETCDGVVVVAVSDPLDVKGLDELSSVSGFELEPVYACEGEIKRLIKESLGLAGGIVGELLTQLPDDEPAGSVIQLTDPGAAEDADDRHDAQGSVIGLVNELLLDAVHQRASDVHIEPLDGKLVIRFRIDGVLHVQPTPEQIRQFYAPIVTRLKIMSRLNIAEKRLPQDGRINILLDGRQIDVRTSIIPTVYGEAVVLRILDKARMVFDLSALGMSPEDGRLFEETITLPHGIILATGPTGSGKTSTLYSILNRLSSPTVKIVTVEDPVEYHLDGISQIQVHPKIGLTFSSGLRSILRHDPDIILIGEIRDTETAVNAIQASMTGHLVLSTLHTNDSCSALTRLVEMGIEPYLVASSVEAVMAQRLVRVLCPHCKVAYRPDRAALPADFPDLSSDCLFQPRGCRECSGTGYRGRVAVFELLRSNETIRRMCAERATTSTIRRAAIEETGLTTLRQSGWQRVLQGVTSVDEVTQITKGVTVQDPSSDATVPVHSA